MAADDPFARHEVLHTSHIMVLMFEEFIASHPVVEADPMLNARAQDILSQLADFYQLCGQVSDTSADPPVVFDDDNPEWTEEDFDRARPAAEVLPGKVVAALTKGKQK